MVASMQSFWDRLSIYFQYGFRINKPLLLWRILTNYLKILLLRQRPLLYIDFVVDYACNLRCEHCFTTFLKKAPDSRQLTLADYRRVAKEAISLGAIHFSFQGGEPLLSDKLEDVIRAFEPHKSYISVTTNATLLNENKVRRLKAVGVDQVNISLDSAIADEHDTFRGAKGTFNRALEALNAALRNGMKVTINTTVSHRNIKSEGMTKLFNFAIQNRIKINPIFAAPLGNWDGSYEVMLTNEDVDFINELRARSPYVRRDMDSNYITWGCGAVKEVLYITPYGDVLPCPFLHISLGNVLCVPLQRIRERGLGQPIFSEYRAKCLASEDKDFIERYLAAIAGKKNLPIELSDMFPGSDQQRKTSA